MTRKDYVAFAEMLQAVRRELKATGHHMAAVSQVEDAMATVMGRDNPRFDRERFLFLCRYTGPAR